MSRTLSTLLVTLFAALVFHAAASEFRFTVLDEANALVGVGKVEVESDEIELELDLLRGVGGFVDVFVDVPGADPFRYPAFFGAAGLIVEIDGEWLDLAAFAATFGQGQRLDVDVEFEDRLDRDDDRDGRDDDDDWDDDRYGRDDDDDDDWDDDRDGRDDDDDDDDDDEDDD